MDKQKVNTTSSMNCKGYSSSSHYRISSVVDESERLVATKFVRWERMSLEEKNWLCETMNSNTYFRTAVSLQDWRFYFFDVLKRKLVNQYGQ